MTEYHRLVLEGGSCFSEIRAFKGARSMGRVRSKANAVWVGCIRRTHPTSYYDPALGRFTQADSLIPQPGNPLDWAFIG